MAYIEQETKKKINLALKKVIPKSWKWSLGINHYSTLVLTVWSAPVDMIADHVAYINARNTQPWQHRYEEKPTHISVNHHWLDEQFVSQELTDLWKRILETIKDAGEWFDKSDIQTDYFNTAFYISLNLGRWDKPFEVK